MALLKRQALVPCSTCTEWFWPPSPTISRTIAAGYSSFEHLLRIETDPGPGAAFLWAHQFRLVGGSGGYLGLHAGGTAVLFLADGLEGEGPGTVGPGEDGRGRSCTISYPAEIGRSYNLSVYRIDQGWWDASVVDEQADVETWIGRVRVPDSLRGLDWSSVMRSDYLGGPVADCSQVPLSLVTFGTPVADGSIAPQACQHGLVEPGADRGGCTNSRIDVVAEGVRHQIGS